MKSADNLVNAEFLSLVPAGGLGSRLGCLTVERAKPSLAVSFTSEGEVIRMIDIPLNAIRAIGGAALVSTLYAPHSLEFVNRYTNVRTFRETGPRSPIDTLIANISLLRSSQASIVGIVPGDALVDEAMLEGMRVALEDSGVNAAILATRKLDGHNKRMVNSDSIVTTEDYATDTLADLGVHFMRKEWLLEQLTPYGDAVQSTGVDIWEDVYCISHPSADILMFVPDDDPEYVDMGTPENFYKATIRLNESHADRNNNILFPRSKLSRASTHTIALPDSHSKCALSRVVIPEGCHVSDKSETLSGERAA